MIFEGETIAQILNLAHLFINPYIALGFLSLPYIFMLMLDLRSRRTRYVYKALGKEESLVRKEKKK
jgi:hypothetical protein